MIVHVHPICVMFVLYAVAIRGVLEEHALEQTPLPEIPRSFHPRSPSWDISVLCRSSSVRVSLLVGLKEMNTWKTGGALLGTLIIGLARFWLLMSAILVILECAYAGVIDQWINFSWQAHMPKTTNPSPSNLHESLHCANVAADFYAATKHTQTDFRGRCFSSLRLQQSEILLCRARTFMNK